MRYKFCYLVVPFAILALATGPLQGGDWPTYRGDAARTGYSSEPLGDDLELRWIYRNRTAPTPAWPDSSRITFDFAYQPIIVGDTVVFGSSAVDKVVACFTAATVAVRCQNRGCHLGDFELGGSFGGNWALKTYPNNPLYPQGKPDGCVVGEKTFSTQLDMKDTTLSNGVNVEKTTSGEPFWPAALASPENT